MNEMGPGNRDEFDVLTRLGADLPGAVLLTPDTGVPATASTLNIERFHGFKAPVPDGAVKLSLAGVQLKFTGTPDGERFTAPSRGYSGRCMIKVNTEAIAVMRKQS